MDPITYELAIINLFNGTRFFFLNIGLEYHLASMEMQRCTLAFELTKKRWLSTWRALQSNWKSLILRLQLPQALQTQLI